jgi:hypothetical protein
VFYSGSWVRGGVFSRLQDALGRYLAKTIPEEIWWLGSNALNCTLAKLGL